MHNILCEFEKFGNWGTLYYQLHSILCEFEKFGNWGTLYRAYPGSEFVVANTVAKWKKLELNEIEFSQGFSEKVVSRSCSLFNSLPASSDFCHLLITFANSLDPDHNVGSDLDPNCLTP